MFSDNGGPSYDDHWREQAHKAWAELKELRRDAERYRWLRDDGDGPANAIAAAVAEGDNEHGGEYVSWLYGNELDAAIDAAMSGAAGGGK